MLYLFQVTLYTGLFWGLYRALGRDRLSAAAARVHLLLATGLPLLLPVFVWHWSVAAPVPQALARYWGGTLRPTVVRAFPSDSAEAVSWWALAYVVVAAFLALRLVVRYAVFTRQLRGRPYEPYGAYRLYRSSGIGPASFGRSIYLPGAEAPEAVLQHECAHLRLHHTADLLVLEVLRCLFWPNLFLAAIFRELKLVHEYAADAAAAAATPDYLSVLIASALPKAVPGAVHPFAQRVLTRRLVQLRRGAAAPGRKRTAAIAFAGLCALVVVVQSCQKAQKEADGLWSRGAYAIRFAEGPSFLKGKTFSNRKPPLRIPDTMTLDGVTVYTGVDRQAQPPAGFDRLVQEALPGWRWVSLDEMPGSDRLRDFRVASIVVREDGVPSLTMTSGKNDPKGFHAGVVKDPVLLRLLAQSPAWTPAQKAGRAVASDRVIGFIPQ